MKNSLKSFIFAVLIQFLILASTCFWVIMRDTEAEKLLFESNNSIHLSKDYSSKKKSMRELRQICASVEPDAFLSLNRLQVASIGGIGKFSSFSSTDLADYGAADFSTAIVIEDSFELVDLAKSSLDFMGVQSNGGRVLILFDISSSVKTKLERVGRSMESIREETKALLAKLNSNTIFGLIQFSRKYDSFNETLLPATKKNKALAVEWLDSRFRTNGQSGYNWVNENPNGIESVLLRAFEMDPDVIFLLSDGDFQRNPISGTRGNQNVSFNDLNTLLIRLQDKNIDTVELHFIGVEMKVKHREWMDKLCQKWDGSLSNIKN